MPRTSKQISEFHGGHGYYFLDTSTEQTDKLKDFQTLIGNPSIVGAGRNGIFGVG